MEDYRKTSLERYIQDLSAKLPAPGGGSAAALAACLGTSLISMVVNFTVGKTRYAQYETELKSILDKAEKLKERFLGMVDLDVRAYQSKNLQDSLNIPFMVCRLCSEAMKLCPQLIKKGNVNLISDVAVAAVLLESAFASAKYNVEINLKSLPDKKLKQRISAELKAKERIVKRLRLKTEVSVGKIIRG